MIASFVDLEARVSGKSMLVFILVGLLFAIGCGDGKPDVKDDDDTPKPAVTSVPPTAATPTEIPTSTPTLTPTPTFTPTPTPTPTSTPSPTLTPTPTPTSVESEMVPEAEDVRSGRRIAVLISTDIAENRLPGNAGFWYDTVLTYCMLLKNGFSSDDIYVLYGDGHDSFYRSDDSTQEESRGSADSPSSTDQAASGRRRVCAEHDPRAFYEPPYCSASASTAGNAEQSHSSKITDFPMMMPNKQGLMNGRISCKRHFSCLMTTF